MRYFAIDENRLVEAPPADAQVLVAAAPDEEERARLRDRFRLDEYDLASTLDSDEAPRLEAANGRLLVIWQVPESAAIAERVELGVSVTGICLSEDCLAFIRAAGEVPFSDREYRSVQNVRDVMLALLLRTVRHYVGHLRVIRSISREIEAKITVSMENKHLLQMFALSESLVYYLDAIEGNGAVLIKLRGVAGQYGFDPRQLELLDDIILENAQAGRQAQIFSSVLSGLMDARGTIVNNNMNVLLKNLTLINIVFLPLNLIASILGMSEWSMMTSGYDWRVSYAVFALGMVLLGWATWVFMRKVVERGMHRRRRLAAGYPIRRAGGG